MWVYTYTLNRRELSHLSRFSIKIYIYLRLRPVQQTSQTTRDDWHVFKRIYVCHIILAFRRQFPTRFWPQTTTALPWSTRVIGKTPTEAANSSLKSCRSTAGNEAVMTSRDKASTTSWWRNCVYNRTTLWKPRLKVWRSELNYRDCYIVKQILLKFPKVV